MDREKKIKRFLAAKNTVDLDLDAVIERKWTRIVRRVWLFFEAPDSSIPAKIYAVTQVCIILLSLTISILLSMEDFHNNRELLVVDVLCDINFFLEVALRLLFCPDRKKFFLEFFNVVDVLSVAPLVMSVIIQPNELFVSQNDIPFLKFLLVIRCSLRLFKIARHFPGFHVLIITFNRSWEALPVPLFLLFFIVICAGSILHGQEKEPPYDNIPKACWFSMVTVTTVGYGQTIPQTDMGKVFAGVLIIVGVVYTAMPISIIGNNFTKAWSERDMMYISMKLSRRMKHLGPSGACEVFAMMDADGDGEMSLLEFKKLINQLGIYIPDSRIRAAFMTIDASTRKTEKASPVQKSGKITIRKFSSIVFKDNIAFQELTMKEWEKFRPEEASEFDLRKSFVKLSSTLASSTEKANTMIQSMELLLKETCSIEAILFAYNGSTLPQSDILGDWKCS